MAFLDKLDANAIPYAISRARQEALLINVAVPGERWEIEFMADGSVEIERFCSDGAIADESALGELFARYTEPTNGHYRATTFADPVAAT